MGKHKTQYTQMKFHPGTGAAGCSPDTAEEFREAFPDVVWHYEPWYGHKRNEGDVSDDPQGRFIHVNPEPWYAAD